MLLQADGRQLASLMMMPGVLKIHFAMMRPAAVAATHIKQARSRASRQGACAMTRCRRARLSSMDWPFLTSFRGGADH